MLSTLHVEHGVQANPCFPARVLPYLRSTGIQALGASRREHIRSALTSRP
jgi:hypothetical protein